MGLTSAVSLTTLTFTLSATQTWSQTKTNQNSFTCLSTRYPGCVEEIPSSPYKGRSWRVGFNPPDSKA